jgi:hypothetical protein
MTTAPARDLVARDDPAAHRIAAEGQEILDARAVLIPDPVLRQSFLDKVPAHVQLRQLSAQVSSPRSRA